MQLRILKVDGPELSQFAAQLPVGKIYASGHGFVPQVGTAIYDRLVQFAAPAPTPGLPATWDDIDVGHLVIARDELAAGWWEAIVIAKDGDMLTLKWRDYPKTGPCRTAPRGARPAKADSSLAGTGMARADFAARAPPNHDFWRSAVDTRTERIRALNDELRQYLLGG